MESVKGWVAADYAAEPMASVQHSLRVAYVVFSFCAAFFLGGIKGTPFLSCKPIAFASLAMFWSGAPLCCAAPACSYLCCLMRSGGGRARCRRRDDSGQRRRHTRALPGARLVGNLLAHQVSRPTTIPCVLLYLLYSIPAKSVVFSLDTSE